MKGEQRNYLIVGAFVLLATLVAGWLRRQDFYTTTDWMVHQYGESSALRAVTSVTAMLVSMGWWVSQPIAAGKVMHALTGLPLEAGILVSAAAWHVCSIWSRRSMINRRMATGQKDNDID